jgi:uncharacterized protein (DUF1330 family)
MPAYLIAAIEIFDEPRLDRYREVAPPIVEKFGGRFLASSKEVVSLEGGWRPHRVVVVEFPTVERATAFFHSPEYQAAIKMREGAAELKILVVDGL